jgi:hypothetical protein
MSESGTVIVAGHWHDRPSELSFVTRAIAGAASRRGPVWVLVPGTAGGREPDGAFDLEGMGEGGGLRWPDAISSDCTVVVDDLTPAVAELLTRIGPRAVFSISGGADLHAPTWRPLHLLDGDDGHPLSAVSVYVPVNPLAERHRHHGFGFTGYQLVLSDSSGAEGEPPPAVAWLSAAFHEADVLVVQDAVASAWKGRALRGRVTVDTRMDLWRLVAHANVCIDLHPGPYIARECVEALRFGTPIIVPAHSGPAAVHARASGGSTFADPCELLEASAKFQSVDAASAASDAGRHYADGRYGDPGGFVKRVCSLLSEV